MLKNHPAQAGHRVSIRYTGRLKDGTVFDSTTDKNKSFKFTLGEYSIIKGLNTAIEGMKVGDSKVIEVPADDAFGQYNHELLVKLSPTKIPSNSRIGDILASPDDKNQTWHIKEIQEDFVLLDGNHPLAGQDLIFDVELLDLKMSPAPPKYGHEN